MQAESARPCPLLTAELEQQADGLAQCGDVEVRQLQWEGEGREVGGSVRVASASIRGCLKRERECDKETEERDASASIRMHQAFALAPVGMYRMLEAKDGRRKTGGVKGRKSRRVEAKVGRACRSALTLWDWARKAGQRVWNRHRSVDVRSVW